MFANGSYAKVWEIKRIEEKYSDIRISTSKKKDDGSYEEDFGGFVRMVGKAHKAMDFINEKDKFKIVSCGVESHYDKEKKVKYTNFIIFDAEPAEPKEEEPIQGSDENPFI
ncbi:MAG: hypothetical protein IKT37_07860 [Clostridia bacterium]|nr:hypothetical protein [Clostridia bacterium]